MVSQACLHRFCAFCARGANCCPFCGVSTHFKIDLNFALIVSKVKARGKCFVKRRIVDVLYGDGANLSSFGNGRLSRMSATQEKEKERTSHQSSTRFVHESEPSTSSAQFNEAIGNGDTFPLQKSGNVPHQMNGVVNYIAVPTPFCCSSPLPPISVDSESNASNKNGNSLINRRSLCKHFVDYEPIVLWPDGENFKMNDLPKCLLRPRHLLIPPEATVAHLVGYLFKRAEIEATWKQRKYHVEFMKVEEEREELRLWMDPMRNIEYLIRDFKNNLQENSEAKSQAYMLIVRKTQNDLNFNTNLIMSHPFKALSDQQLLVELIREHKNNGIRTENKTITQQQGQVERRQFEKTQSQRPIRPLKIVFRFVINAM
ncbi:hypothetical protein niasHT_003777 [Heterodera trifolii]|uniref:Uncharacterized protein n=1 Tax=Heterodera trifolii TaxID=157864 RepID=A0ABD2LUX2_9BILA